MHEEISEKWNDVNHSLAVGEAARREDLAVGHRSAGLLTATRSHSAYPAAVHRRASPCVLRLLAGVGWRSGGKVVRAGGEGD